MKAEILTQIPVSGDFQEIHFGKTFKSQLWIKFIDNNFQEWVGCFARSYQTWDKVLTDEANETAFIVAGGQCYLIDISTKELLHHLNEDSVIESVIQTTNPKRFLVSICNCIYIFDNKKLIKHYKPPFIVDGIYFTAQKEQKAIGHLYSYENEKDFFIGFSFDLITHEMTIDKNVKIRQVGPYEFVTVTEKEVMVNKSLFTKILRRLTDKWK